MNIFLADGGQKLIPNDLVIFWANRSDLTPVPRTVEFVCQIKNDLEAQLQVGGYIWTGGENHKYEILKVERGQPMGIQDDSPLQALTVYAVLESCARICYRLDRPAIKRNTTIGGMYRACGASVAIESDIAIDSFACLKGDVPSFAIARSMQEASAVLVLEKGKVGAMRINDLMKRDPVETIGQSASVAAIKSEFLERHEIPSFYTTNTDGSLAKGNFDKARQVRYIPRKDENTLHNMSRVLVNRIIIESDMVQSIQAGMVVDVNGKKQVIITAAHWAYTIDGVVKTGSKMWAGEVV